MAYLRNKLALTPDFKYVRVCLHVYVCGVCVWMRACILCVVRIDRTDLED